ncbi:MAG: preprotein translocase subunit YajC [Acidaminococcaceae bacterium]|jgi:preprotein translocase subunit YajC|nr:preprotein translocase subunit YajC [Acidaminococcaceae bacterium]
MEEMNGMAIVNTVWPFLLMGLIFYFMLYRPQKKEQNQRNTMLNALKKGDQIVTIGGICGEITKISDEYVHLKVNETTEMKFIRGAVARPLRTTETK